MGFNEFQQAAIDASSQEDILVSAGAGSGKTKTLSERVYTLIDKGEVAPESLLVLTFTNNAAHEMKTRILARFPATHPAAKRMLSCHVQSFDSFNAYLVRRYASRLGVSPSIQILSESIHEQKKRLFLDEAFDEACAKSPLKEDLLRVMKELGLKNEKYIKGTVLDLLGTVERLPPQEQKAFFDKIQTDFLGQGFAHELYLRCLEEYKKSLRRLLREAYLLDLCRNELMTKDGSSINVENLRAILGNDAYYSVALENVDLSPDSSQKHDFLNEEYHGLLSLTQEKGEDLVAKAETFLAEHGEEYFQRNYPGSSTRKAVVEAHYHAPVFKALKQAKAVLEEIVSLGKEKQQWEKMTRFDYAVRLFATLGEQTFDKLADYQKKHNAYTFATVTSLALSLFTDPKLEDIAETLRKRFTYVMVDEYQDTNDAQEIFINGLLKPNENGGRAHLFCVGDAKQSIYAFRGSNVALFRARQAQYQGAKKGAKVIPMAINYRSAKTLLDQINYLFRRYMRLDHGGIDYTDPIETLGYDDEVNLYKVELPGYGIHRIVPPQSSFLTKDVSKLIHYDPVAYEAKAILTDIQQKLSSGFLVFDRDFPGGVRPCRKNDFCILVRRKRSVAAYQRLFAENGIALNNRVSQDLRDASAISLIQSLLRLLCLCLGQDIPDFAHCFASVARSYAFRYDDSTLHRLLSADNTYDQQKAEALMWEDPIMVNMKQFALEAEGQSFAVVFLGLLDRFGVIENLYRIGAVEDNLAKIESLYALALSQGNIGEGLSAFVALLEDMDKRQLPLDSESVFETADAVDLMTIHASKGLERKIVYMPSSDNGLGKGSNDSSSLAKVLSREFGMALPDAGLPYLDANTDNPILTATLPIRYQSLAKRNEEEQENVRLLYVALTRAENAVYLVGQNRGDNSVYIMMEDVPNFLQINPILLQNPNISPSLRQQYEAYVNRKMTAKPMVSSSLGEDLAKVQKDLLSSYCDATQDKEDESLVVTLLWNVFLSYQSRFVSEDAVKLFARVYYPSLWAQGGMDSLDALRCAIKASSVEQLDEEDEEGEGSFVDEGEELDSLAQRVELFAQGIREAELSLLCPNLKLSKEHEKDLEYRQKVILDLLLLPLVQHYDGLDYAYRQSYQSAQYPDDTATFDEASFVGAVSVAEPELLKLNQVDDPLNFVHLTYARASKEAVDADLPSSLALERGSKLHRYMQLLDFDALDLSFIPEKDRPMIEKVLATPLMQLARNASGRYPEYSYYDPETMREGSIDLLFVVDGVYHVVDYKTSHIDDPDYDRQVRVYGHNVMRLFGARKENVRLHLLSLRFAKSKDVELEEGED